MVKDRVTAGFISGIIAGIAMNIVDWIGFIIGFHEERLLDWAAIAIYGHLPNTLAEIIFAQMGQLFFAGFLGFILSVILLKLTSGNYLIKGLLFGLIAWFALYAISIAIRLPSLEQHTLNTTISHFISSSVYGLLLTFTLNWFDKASFKV